MKFYGVMLCILTLGSIAYVCSEALKNDPAQSPRNQRKSWYSGGQHQRRHIGGIYDPYWDNFDNNYMYSYNYLDEENSTCKQCAR